MKTLKIEIPSEMKTLNIEIPVGHEIDQEQSNLSEGRIVFKEIKKVLPKTWEELKVIRGYYVGADSFIREANCTSLGHNKNTFATKELVEASIAMAQLSQLREVYRQGWKPNWDDEDKEKHVIEFVSGTMHENHYYVTCQFLSFQSAEIRDEFLKNFASLIETAKPLMS